MLRFETKKIKLNDKFCNGVSRFTEVKYFLMFLIHYYLCAYTPTKTIHLQSALKC